MLVRGQLTLNRGFGVRRQKRIRFSGHGANPSEGHPTVTCDLDAPIQASYDTGLSTVQPYLLVPLHSRLSSIITILNCVYSLPSYANSKLSDMQRD